MLDGGLGLEQRGQGLRLAVGEKDGVILGCESAVLRAGPCAGIAPDAARPRLALDQPEAHLGQDEQIDLVDRPVARSGTRSWPTPGTDRRANFEFQTDDGAIYEVDLLVLTKQGFWLVEMQGVGRSHLGRRRHLDPLARRQDPLRGQPRPARQPQGEGPLVAAQGPVRRQQGPAALARRPGLPVRRRFQCDLTGPARNRVCLKDRPADEHHPERKGILAALINRDGPGIDPDLRSTIDIKVAKALSRAMEQAGIRPSQRSRRVGDYVLGDLIADGPGYQDRLAKHASFDERVLPGPPVHGRPGLVGGGPAAAAAGGGS